MVYKFQPLVEMTQLMVDNVDMEFKSLKCNFDIKQQQVGEIDFVAIANTTDEDLSGDIVTVEAYQKAIERLRIRNEMPKFLYQHQASNIIGTVKNVKIEGNKLIYEAKFSEIQLGRDVKTLLKEGAIDSSSIGFVIIDSERVGENRVVKDFDFMEVSIVTFPMNNRAKALRVKALPQTERDFERFLRDAGFSRKRACAISSAGFKVSSRGDPDDLFSYLVELKNSFRS